MPDTWIRKDEWYNFKDLNPDVTVLIKIDESSYTGGENGANHPMAWYHALTVAVLSILRWAILKNPGPIPFTSNTCSGELNGRWERNS